MKKLNLGKSKVKFESEAPSKDSPIVLEALSYSEKCLLYVLGLVDELQKSGYAEMEGIVVTEAGLALFEKLKATGFRPTEQEIEDIIRVLSKE